MARWLEQQQARLLHCAHRHIIFTIAHELHPLWYSAQAQMTEVLFASVRETLLTLCRDPQHLGAEPGFVCALHTWGRSLSLHPHIHCLVSEGGADANQHWRNPRRTCFLPARVVMALFRGKILGKLRQLIRSGKLPIPSAWSQQQALNLCNRLGRKKWNVHLRERYQHGNGVVKYLARYLRGGPLNNRQLTHLSDIQVRFRYVPHSDPARRVAEMQLTPQAFLQRYLQHVPLQGKPSVRHYGCYASGKRRLLNTLRAQFDQAPVTPPAKLTWQRFMQSFGAAATMPNCPLCGAPVRLAEAVPRPARRPRSLDPSIGRPSLPCPLAA